MNRITLGVGCGVVFGLADVLMTIAGNHPDRNISMLIAGLLKPIRDRMAGNEY